MNCPSCSAKITSAHYDADAELVWLTPDDRAMLKEASEMVGNSSPYMAGRLAGLSGRVPAEVESEM